MRPRMRSLTRVPPSRTHASSGGRRNSNAAHARVAFSLVLSSAPSYASVHAQGTPLNAQPDLNVTANVILGLNPLNNPIVDPAFGGARDRVEPHKEAAPVQGGSPG